MHRTLLLLAVVLTTSCVRADVVYNNLGPGDTFSASGRILIGPEAGVFSDVNQAASFSVGPTAHHLTDVVLGLGVNEYPVKPFVPSLVNVHIAADAAGSPGTVLLSLPYSITTMGDQAITVQDAGSLLLAANTDYWVIADAEGEFNGSWRYNDLGANGSHGGANGRQCMESSSRRRHVRAPDWRYAFSTEPQCSGAFCNLTGSVELGTRATATQKSIGMKTC